VFTTRPVLAGTFGMVASTHWLATAAGMAVLESGGNAFDAAAAAGFALHVVEPHLNGPGGEVPAIFATASDPTPTVLCGQGTAPAGATIERLRDRLGLDLVPGTGLLPATVPGAIGGWLALLRDHGSTPLRDVLGYAIEYAQRGHPVHARVAGTIAAMADHFRAAWPTSADVWLPGNRPPRGGDLLRQPVLAQTYRRLLAEAEAAGTGREAQLEGARRAWYEGFVAEEIDAFCRREWLDDSGRPHAGVLTGDDMARWRATYERPVTLDWRDVTVCKVGAWSQGPVLLQQLALLAGFGDDVLRHGSAEQVHVAVECAKLAFADREAWYGDVPDVPLDDLLSPSYADSRRGLVGAEASHQLRPGAPGGRRPRLPSYLQARAEAPVATGAEPGLGEPTVSAAGTTRGDTCHVDVVDRWGNMISATPSGGWLQSSPAIPALGFCLGTRGQMFWLEEGLPASLAPGRRPRITLSPTLVVRAGVPVLACGTPGGDQQDQWQLCFLLAHLVAGLDLQAAIDAPAWHTNAFPSSFFPRVSVPGEVVVEDRLGDDVVDELRRRGHRVTVSDPWSLGRLSAVSRDPATGVVRAAANPRGMQGYAAGR
jgi:gamma-glutamyltranspeptidase / glutathione hydrolase